MEFSCPVQAQQRLTFALELIFNSVFCLAAGPKPLSTEWKLVLHLLVSSILSIPEGHPVAAYFFFLVFPLFLPSIFPSLTCFRIQFLRNPTNPSVYCMQDIPLFLDSV